MISLMRKRAHSGERWREIIAKQPATGLSIAAYCRQRWVPAASFYASRRKPRRASAHFAEARMAPDSLAESSGIEVRLSNGRSVVVRAGFDRRTLLELLAALEHGAGASAAAAASGTARHDGVCGAAAAREAGAVNAVDRVLDVGHMLDRPGAPAGGQRVAGTEVELAIDRSIFAAELQCDKLPPIARIGLDVAMHSRGNLDNLSRLVCRTLSHARDLFSIASTRRKMEMADDSASRFYGSALYPMPP